MTYDACAALVHDHDRDRWATARLAGPLAGRLHALYAFNLEIARIPSVVSEIALAEIRLQWWRDALDEIFSGRAPRRHEVVLPLAETIEAADLPRDLFEALFDARSYDPHGPAFGDRPLFDAYLDGTAAGLMRLGVLSLGVADQETDLAAREAGHAAGAAALIRALPALYARGGDPIPTEDELVRNDLAEGRTPETLRKALKDIAEDALARLSAARGRKVDPAARPALFAGFRAEETLRPAARPGFELFAQAEPSEFRRRAGLAARVLTGRW